MNIEQELLSMSEYQFNELVDRVREKRSRMRIEDYNGKYGYCIGIVKLCSHDGITTNDILIVTNNQDEYFDSKYIFISEDDELKITFLKADWSPYAYNIYCMSKQKDLLYFGNEEYDSLMLTLCKSILHDFIVKNSNNKLFTFPVEVIFNKTRLCPDIKELPIYTAIADKCVCKISSPDEYGLYDIRIESCLDGAGRIWIINDKGLDE